MGKSIDQIVIHTDGGSRGNPGPAAAAFVFTDKNNNQLVAKAFCLGQATNNVAEYTAVVKALQTAKQIGVKSIQLFSDSELLVKQINGQYKVKSEQLRPLFRQAMELLDEFENPRVQFTRREQNIKADELVNRALDLGKDIEEMNKMAKSNKKPIRLGVLISGGGTTLINILEYINQGKLNAEVALVISSRSTAAGVERAKAAGLNVEIIRKKDSPDVDEFSKRIEEKLTAANVELVIQAGWLCLWKIPEKFTDRVMNIHPALLPSFGGQGMWGHHVHEAVLEKGCKISGCTVHFCTNEYDKGPIVVQRTCEVAEDDTPETLAARVFEQECIAYPQAIRLFADGKIKVQNDKAKITNTNNE